MTEFLQINTLERYLLEATTDRLPCFTTPCQCLKVPSPIGTQCSGGDHQFSARTVRCLALNFPKGLFLGLLANGFELIKSTEKFIGISVATMKSFQNRAKKQDAWASILECVCFVAFD